MSSRKLFSLFGSITIQGISASKEGMKELNSTAAKLGKRFNALRKETLAVGKAITKNITAPILAAGGAAVKFGADFDKAMTDSLAIMGDVSDTMRKDMEGVARSVAKDLNIPATKAAEAYYFLASAGLDAAESMAALPKVAAFAKAGNFDLATATDLLTDAQSALGKSSDDTAEHIENMVEVSDLLVKANTIANASVEQFSESLTNRGGAALRLLNKETSEGIAVLSVFADQGIKGAEAGTKLDIVMRDLQKAAISNKQAFRDAGVTVFDADGKMRHLADIVQDLEGRLGSMSDEQKRGELTTLGFTDKSIAATTALLGTSDAIREYEKQLKSAAGTTDEVAQKRLQGFWEQMGKIQKRLIDLSLTLYESLSPTLMNVVVPALDAVIDKIGELINWFQQLPGWVQDSVKAFGAVIAVAGPMLIIISKIMPLIKGAILLYKAWTAGQIALNVAMSANPVGLIVIAIGALVAAGYVLVKNWDTVKEKFIDVWEWMQDQKVFTFIVLQVKLWIKAGKMLIDNWEEIKQTFINVWEWLEANPAIKRIVFPIFALIDAGKWVIENWKEIKKTWDDVWGFFDRNPIIKRLVFPILGLIDAGQWLIENLDTIGVRWRKVWTGISHMFEKIVYGIQVQYNKVILGLIDGVDKLGQFIPGVNKGLRVLRREIEANITTTEREQKLRDKAHKSTVANMDKEIAAILERSKAEKEAKKAERAAAKAKREEEKKLAKEEEEAKKKAKKAKEEEEKAKIRTAAQIKAAREAAEERKKIAEKERKEREDIENGWSNKLAQITKGRIELLKHERGQALKIAREKGASTLDIEEYYARKIGEARLQAAKETSDKIEEVLRKRLFGELRAQIQHTKGLKEQKKIAVENAKEFGGNELEIAKMYDSKIKDSRIQAAKAGIESSVQAISNGINIINSLWEASINKRMAEIEEERIAQIEAVQASVSSEEEKSKQIEEINAVANEKKLELQRENAKREKANSLFSIALSTAMGVAAALTIPIGGRVLAGVIAALGAVQLGIAAATPIPFEKGGLVKSDPGKGVIGQIGEGKEDELILPMKTGAAQLADIVVSKIKGAVFTGVQNVPSMAMSGNSEVHLHIGTLIADEFGLKKLEKTLRKYRVSEAQRTGTN